MNGIIHTWLSTWSTSVILGFPRSRTVCPAHNFPVWRALGARKTLASSVVHEQKIPAAAATANGVPRRAARRRFRPPRSTGAAFRALSPTCGEPGEVSFSTRHADCVAAVPAGLGGSFPCLAGGARDAVRSLFLRRSISVESCRAYVFSRR